MTDFLKALAAVTLQYETFRSRAVEVIEHPEATPEQVQDAVQKLREAYVEFSALADEIKEMQQ